MDVDKAIDLEDEGSENCVISSNVKSNNEDEGCRGCLVLQDRIKNADDKCARLESDVANKSFLIQGLESQIQIMELKMLEIGNEIRALKQRNQELENSIHSGVKDEDRVTQLMIENKVLDCEKKRAKTEIEAWKTKFKELEIQVMQLTQNLSGDCVDTGLDLLKYGSATPPNNTPSIHGFGKSPCEFKSRVKMCLDFTSKGSPHQHISPSMPGSRSLFGPISISDDSDDDLNATAHVTMPKRRKVRGGNAYVVSSESETDCDDNIPISELRRKPLSAACPPEDDNSFHEPEKPLPRRHLTRVGDHDKKSFSRSESEIEEDDPSSEGGSLGGFIVNDSDVSESEQPTENYVSENGSESSVAYDEIIFDIQRKRGEKMKWSNEGEMLADFGKYPKLCMEAVCTLYRQQTPVEKYMKATIDRNGRGFSHFHAVIGSELAEFLMDDDPQGDIKKSVEELQEFDAKGAETCWKLATNYSKQLWEIYKNNEDPFFHP